MLKVEKPMLYFAPFSSITARASPGHPLPFRKQSCQSLVHTPIHPPIFILSSYSLDVLLPLHPDLRGSSLGHLWQRLSLRSGEKLLGRHAFRNVYGQGESLLVYKHHRYRARLCDMGASHSGRGQVEAAYTAEDRFTGCVWAGRIVRLPLYGEDASVLIPS
jgi:hypothetical protein